MRIMVANHQDFEVRDAIPRHAVLVLEPELVQVHSAHPSSEGAMSPSETHSCNKRNATRTRTTPQESHLLAGEKSE